MTSRHRSRKKNELESNRLQAMVTAAVVVNLSRDHYISRLLCSRRLKIKFLCYAIINSERPSHILSSTTILSSTHFFKPSAALLPITYSPGTTPVLFLPLNLSCSHPMPRYFAGSGRNGLRLPHQQVLLYLPGGNTRGGTKGYRGK